MALKVGEIAPDFEAPTDRNVTVKLSEILKEKEVVLYFYPKDETPGCTAEACSFRDSWETIKDMGAEVIGVSSDTPEAHRKFRDHHDLQFTLVSDVGKSIREKYGVKGSILPPRTTFVISRDGRIAHVFNSQMAPRRHVEEAISALKALKDGN